MLAMKHFSRSGGNFLGASILLFTLFAFSYLVDFDGLIHLLQSCKSQWHACTNSLSLPHRTVFPH